MITERDDGLRYRVIWEFKSKEEAKSIELIIENIRRLKNKNGTN